MNDSTYQFIKENENSDIYQLSLKSSHFPDVDMEFAIRQIEGRKRAKTKIPYFSRSEKVIYPTQLSVEQSSSEITAKHKQKLCEGVSLLDMTGGFGVDDFFLSFNFERVSYIEEDKELSAIAKHNFTVLGRNNIEVHNQNSIDFLKQSEKFSWIYIDPARRSEDGKKLVLLDDLRPKVVELMPDVLEKSNKILIKLSPLIDISALINQLKQIKTIDIVAVKNECKEVLLVIEKGYMESPIIRCFNYKRDDIVEIFSYDYEEEDELDSKISNNLSKYLYEPNAAIMKSGAMKSVSHHFQLEKIHANSHLFTSNKLIDDFPGRVFEIVDIYDFSKISMKKLNKDLKQANLSIRNFPEKIEILRKRLKLKDGGDNYLFATTLYPNKKIIVSSKKL